MEHNTVLLEETVDSLNLKPGMTIVDGTIGGGGHSEAILERILPGGRLIGIDKDEYALERSQERLKAYSENIEYINDDFKNIKRILGMLEIDGIDGAVLDLGVSSFQLDQCNRGFSYNKDSRLDMRMNIKDKVCAANIVNCYDKKDLERIFRDYGEERWAARIAEFIVRERALRPIETTGHLVEVIKKAVPVRARSGDIHPARRCFQALRIEVNGELDSLKAALIDFVLSLNNGGRIAVITFHSLEDRIVKQEFKKFEDPCECPKSIAVCVCGKKPLGRIITKKPVLPSKDEVNQNNRSRSAKLRVFEAAKQAEN